MASHALADGEEMVVEVHPHWASIGWSIVIGSVVAVGDVVAIVTFTDVPVALRYLLLAVLIGSLGWVGARWLARRATTVTLTTLRLVEQSGVLRRTTREMRLDRVNEISTSLPILGRMLGFGDLMVDMGGERGVTTINWLPHPAAVSGLMTEQMSAYVRGSMGQHGGVSGHEGATGPLPGSAGDCSLPGAARAGDADTPPYGVFGTRDLTVQAGGGMAGRATAGRRTVGDRILELENLRKMGVVTEEEFQAKKAQLLQQL